MKLLLKVMKLLLKVMKHLYFLFLHSLPCNFRVFSITQVQDFECRVGRAFHSNVESLTVSNCCHCLY